MEKQINALVTELKKAVGRNLKSVLLYGSAVSGEFHAKHSDLNVLCVLDRLDAEAIEQLHPVVMWCVRKGHAVPRVFTLEELERAADVFAIELLDIKTNHRVLLGEDVFTRLEVPMRLHHLQVERELRTQLVRLRQGRLAAPDRKAVLGLMTASVSSFSALFRHTLIALGNEPPGPEPKRDTIDRLATLLGFDASGFHAVLDVREGKRTARDVDVTSTFHAYLEAVTRVVDEVDRRLSDRP